MNLLRSLKSKLSSEPVPRKLEDELSTDEIFEYLEKECATFFPANGHWFGSCYKKPEEINRKYLPCHLRDYNWLSELMHEELKEKGVSISTDLIKSFMINSRNFNELRYNDELEIVSWQIEWMDNGGEHWLIPDNFGGDFWIHGGNCDECFRQGVIKTLTAIGMNKGIVEYGLEIYADMWRDKYMDLAFENRYNPTANNFLRRNSIEALPPPVKGHKEMWLTVRKYKYFIEHKRILERLNLVQENMQLEEKQLRKILVELKVTNIQREMLIKKWKEKGAHFLTFDTHEENFNP